MMRVIVHHNNVPIKTYQFINESITIGRLATNNIPVNSMGISRHHLKIERDQSSGEMIIEDMGSLNGSYVYGQKVDKTAITSGAEVVLGKYSLIVEFTDSEIESQTVSPEIQTSYDETPSMLTNEKTPDGSVTSETSSEAITISLDDDTEEQEESPMGDGNFVFTSSAAKAKAGQKSDESDPVDTNAVLIDLKRQVIYKINKTQMTFGSDKSADIFVESGVFSSDNLATLAVEEDSFIITKGNGKLKVNDKKVPSHVLNHKDKVKIDNSEFSFMIKDN